MSHPKITLGQSKVMKKIKNTNTLNRAKRRLDNF